MAIKGYLVHNLTQKKTPFFASQIQEWIRVFKGQRIDLKTIDNLSAYEVIKKEKPAFVLFWDKDIALLYQLLNLGVKVFNNVDAIRLADDKALTYAMLMKNNIATPKTLIMPLTFMDNGVKYFSFIKKQLKDFAYPLVIKERCNSLGEGVYLVRSENALKKVLKSKWYHNLLIQEYIGYEVGKDYRVYLINHRPKAVVTRINKHDFRSNVMQGGKMKAIHNPDANLLKLAIRASLALHLDFGAVDIIKDANHKYLVLEVNSNARTISIDKIAKTSLTKDVAKYILNNLY